MGVGSNGDGDADGDECCSSCCCRGTSCNPNGRDAMQDVGTTAADDDDDDDEELRQAKELAMAIQQNPNMTMAQIHQLLDKRKGGGGGASASAKTSSSNPLNIPQLHNPFAKGKQTNLLADWNRLQGKLQGNMMKILQQGGGGGGKDNSNSSEDDAIAATKTAAAASTTAPTITATTTTTTTTVTGTSAKATAATNATMDANDPATTLGETNAAPIPAAMATSTTSTVSTSVSTSASTPTPTSALASRPRSIDDATTIALSGSSAPSVPPPAAAPPLPPPASDHHQSPPSSIIPGPLPITPSPSFTSPKKEVMQNSPTRSKHSGQAKAPDRTRSLQKTLKSGVKSGVKSVKKTVSKTIGVHHHKHDKRDKSASPTRGAEKCLSPLSPPGSPRRRGHNAEGVSLPDLSSPGASATAGGDGMAYPADMIRLTGSVWKRRSGFGKYSVSAAWERRRLVLRGTTLWYYKMSKNSSAIDDVKMTAGVADPNAPTDSATNDGGHAPTTASAASGLLSAFPTSSKSKGSWLEQTVNKASASLGMSIITEEDASNSRGHLDIVKDKASVAASFGHSGAPTPFAMSIKLNGITKWKLCFDTHMELMQWLATLSDAIIQGSVDAYNKEILVANDPTVDTTLTFPGQLSEPPTGSKDAKASGSKTAATDETDLPMKQTGAALNEVSGHRLWTMGPYTIKNQEAVVQDRYRRSVEGDGARSIEEDTSISLDDDDGDHDNGDIGIANDEEDDLHVVHKGRTSAVAAFSRGTGTIKPRWTILDSSLLYVGVTLNLAMILCRSSALSPSLFWYVVVFANFILFSYLSREEPIVTMTTVPQLVPSAGKKQKTRKKARRVASKGAIGVGGGVSASASVDSDDAALASSEIETDKKPVAGTSSIRINEPRDPAVDKNGAILAGWRRVPPSGIDIRSQGYASNGKKKVPSPGELYKLVYCDIFESPHRCPDMASRVKLPTVSFTDDKDARKTWNAPDIFVISIALPTDPPKMTRSSEDGGGFTVTMYFVMRQETRDVLRRVTAEGYDPSQEPKPDDPQKSIVNAVKLFEEWCRRAPTDDKFMARFKCVPNAQNLKEIGMPSWISSYNGKPFLIKRPGQTGFLYRHPEYSCMEFDISLHPFPYLAKKGICFMKDTYFKKVLVTFGFTIEGRADDELPECLIGLMQLCYPDPAHAIQGSDFFAGTSPKSHYDPSPHIVNGELVDPVVGAGAVTSETTVTATATTTTTVEKVVVAGN
mmetsp:Transcript_9962/g.28285  ORF Transcript_9962/g.28285 Transcript_9962/m.28285 type:complete len:1235 (-) Transcript_9962:200-3904(-)